MMTVKLSKEAEASLTLMRQWPERTRAIRSVLVFLSAWDVYRSVTKALPSGDAYKAYRNSFRVSRLIGHSESFAMHCHMKARHAQKLDAERTILYVRPRKRNLLPNSPWNVLARYSPWTLTTLPVAPERKMAELVSRRVSKAKVVQVRSKNKETEPLWRRDLANAGVRVTRKNRDNPFAMAKTVPDLAFDAFRLEFGLGGVRPKPHWRPAMRKLVQTGFASISSRKEIVEALTLQRFGTLQRLQKTPYIVRVSEVKDFQTFQEKLGLSGGSRS